MTEINKSLELQQKEKQIVELWKELKEAREAYETNKIDIATLTEKEKLEGELSQVDSADLKDYLKQNEMLKLQIPKLQESFEKAQREKVVIKLGSAFKWEALKTKVIRDLSNDIDDANIPSLINILSEKNGDFLKELSDLSTDDKSKVETILDEAGYINGGWMFNESELNGLIDRVTHYSQTQESLKSGSVSDNNALSILLDFNNDYVLEAGNTPIVSEMQLFTQIKDSNNPEKALENLMVNLNMSEYKDIEDIKSAMGENLFKFKKAFADKLSMAIGLWIKPTILLQEGKINDAVKVKFAVEEKLKEGELSKRVEKVVENYMAKNEKVQELLRALPSEEKANTEKKIKLAAIGVVLGDARGAWASFDINKATEGVFDTFTLGYTDEGIWFGFSAAKHINENVSIGVNNFFPFVSGKLDVFNSTEEVKDLFTTDFRDSSEFDVTANGTAILTIGTGAWLSVSREDNETQRWISERVNEVSKEFVKLIQEAVSGKSFEESSFSEDETAKVVYEDIKYYLEFTEWMTDAQKDIYIESMYNSYMTNYENILYRQADTDETRFSSLGFFSLFVGNVFLPNLVLERIDAKQESSTTGDMVESVITSREVSMDEIGQKVDFQGKEVMFVPGVNEISAPAGVSYQVTEGGIVFGGVVSEINVVKRYLAEEVSYALVVNGGNLEGTTYKYSNEGTEKVERFMKYEERKEKAFSLNENISESIEKLSSITDVLDKTIDARVLYGKLNTGAKEFQQMYRDFRTNGEGGLEKVWDKFEDMIGRSGKASNDALNWSIYYALERDERWTGQAKLEEFRENVKSLAKSPDDKMYILETLFGNLMKDIYIQEKLNLTSDENEALFQKGLKENEKNLKFDEKFTKEKYERFLSDLENAKTPEDWQKLVNMEVTGLDGNDERISPLVSLVFNRMPLAIFESIVIPSWSERAGGNNSSRMKAFDMQFYKAGLWNYPISATQSKYLDSLDGARSVETTKITDGSVLGFPVSANVKAGFYGVNPITWVIEVVNNQENTFVDIEYKDYGYENAIKIVDLIPSDIISNIATTLEKAGAKFTDAEIKRALNGETVRGLSFNYEEVFFKWGDCFNDAVGIKDLTATFNGESFGVYFSNSSEVTIQSNDVDKLGLSYLINNTEKQEKNGEEDNGDIDSDQWTNPEWSETDTGEGIWDGPWETPPDIDLPDPDTSTPITTPGNPIYKTTTQELDNNIGTQSFIDNTVVFPSKKDTKKK